MSPASFAALPFDPAAALAAGGMPPSGAAPKPVIAALAFFEAERREGLMVYRATEPVLRPIRARLPVTMNLDLSPLVVLLALKVAEWVVVDSLRDFAMNIR